MCISNVFTAFLIRHFSTDALFCDCQLKWLLLWARSNAVKIGNDTVCMFPAHLHGFELRNLRELQLSCGKNLTNHIYWLQLHYYYTAVNILRLSGVKMVAVGGR